MNNFLETAALPKIALLVDKKYEDKESILYKRNVYIHIPTSAIVEILHGDEHEFEPWQIYQKFAYNLGEHKLLFTAVLLNYNNPVLSDKLFVIDEILHPVIEKFSVNSFMNRAEYIN